MCWTGSSLYFGLASRAAGAVGVNQFRLFAAVPLMLLLHAVTVGGLWPSDVPVQRTTLLVLSGVFGLAIGDLGYFYALASIGPRLSSVVQASWPGLALMLAWATAAEVPDLREACGLVLTMTGVVVVVWRGRDGSSWRPDLTARQRAFGIAGAGVAALGQAVGMILSRAVMQPGPDLASGIDPLSATVVRLVAGTLAVVVISLCQRQAAAVVVVLRQPAARRHAMLGTMFGPIAGIWLSMIATRHAERAGTAAALMSLTPLFLLPVSFFASRARVTGMAVVGTAVATVGTVLLVTG